MGIKNENPETEKKAFAAFSKVKNAVVEGLDKNNDGKFDMQDVSAVAGVIGDAAKNAGSAIGDAAKNAGSTIKETLIDKKHEWDMRTLCPIFEDSLDDPEFLVSKLIHITNMDEKHEKSEVCQGSIGHITDQDEFPVVHIYKKNLETFGLTLVPDEDAEIYYVDPCDRDKYIALNEYFSYLKIARVNELQKIAQDLGAKHFKVTFKEEKAESAEQSSKKNVSKKDSNNTAIETSHDVSQNSLSKISIEAEMDCPGHAPKMPELVYLKKDPSIQGLIALRMDESSPLGHQKYTIRFSNSSGIKEKDAAKIDATLKAMKISSGAGISKEAKSETRRYLEYEIDF